MIYLVATAIKHGKGGISTALTSSIEVLQTNNVAHKIVESHQSDASRWQSFRQAKSALADAGRGDIVWLHGARWLSLVRKYLLSREPRKRGARVLLHVHGIEAIHYLQHPLGRWLMQRLVNRFDGLIVLTPWWRTQLAQFLSYPADRIHVMPNTLDRSLLSLAQQEGAAPPRSAPQKKEGQPPSERIDMLCMTRLEPGKNVGAAIATLQHLPVRYHLTVAGDGSELDMLRQHASRCDVADRVHFVGWVPYEKKAELLGGMDLFFLPSELDSFGMGFLEAMAAGLPVVGVAYGPIVDVVPEGAGCLVSQPDPGQLAVAVEKVMAEHAQHSYFARQHVLEHYQPEIAVRDFLEFCQRLT
ncbi:glycosyltransferase family 4 protein [Pseudidiomarina sp. E22-M8]|uniref:glycosyltransferase family 4 protein n=1 Tax=Pseudidiomarina sp. E22-M8 TaxID=3424768 RepID=UPI00403C5232